MEEGITSGIPKGVSEWSDQLDDDSSVGGFSFSVLWKQILFFKFRGIKWEVRTSSAMEVIVIFFHPPELHGNGTVMEAIINILHTLNCVGTGIEQ